MSHFQTYSDHKPIKIEYEVAEPKKAIGAIILVHGLGEHKKRYEEISNYFSGQHYAVYRFDLRGHGESEGKRGHVNRFGEYVSDLIQMIEIAKKKHPKIILLGHSMGGLVVSYYLTYFKVDPSVLTAVVINPAYALKLKVPVAKLIAGKVLLRILPRFQLYNEIKPNTLTHDRSIEEAYFRDPLVHQKITPKTFFDMMFVGRQIMNNADKWKVPTLFMIGGIDPITDIEASKEVYYKLQVDKKRLKVYDGFLHEVLNEVGRERAYADILDWCNSFIPN